MKTINFSDQELESMLMMYYDELAEANHYVEQIEEIIKKLSGKPAIEKMVEKQPKQVKRGRKPSVKSAEVKEPKKRGRKPNAKPSVEKKPQPKSTATVESVEGSL